MIRSVATGLMIAMLFTLSAGMVASPTAEANTSYTVRGGDSLWSIAQRNGVTVHAIKQASNHWSDTIRPGQRLVIPAQATSRSSSGGVIGQFSQAERDLLARVVAAEAQGEPYTGKVGVAAVIFNRVKDDRFPNTISGVIHQRHAFESVTNELVWRRTPGAQAHNAVRDAAGGWDPTGGSVFFWNPYKPVNAWIWSRPIVTQFGNHVFAL